MTTSEPVVAAEAQAYSPGLKVKRCVTVRKTRRLPLKGEVLVKKGDIVDYSTTIAQVMMPGRPEIIKAAGILNVDADEIEKYCVKKVGEPVKEGEVIARCITMFGMIKKYVYTPTDGVVDSISSATGRITIRANPEPVTINAYIPGKVVEVIEGDGAIIQTESAYIQGIFGIGGEQHGSLVMMVNSPEDTINADQIKQEHKGKILVVGSIVTSDILKKGVQIGVSGIIAGGIKEEDLTNFIGHPIGVAITGEEEVGLSLIVTEGFGKLTMSRRTFNLLKEFDGYMTHINGATQIRAGVQRPELIIPINETATSNSDEDKATTMKHGTPVRIIQNPYFGELGFVIDLPINLEKVETEADVRVVDVELQNGKKVTVPRANVEVIEE